MAKPPDVIPVEHEVFDSQIIESINGHFVNCFFLECEIVGRNNTFTRCTFQGSPALGGALLNDFTFIECLFDAR